jgi:hypothetical protein
MARADERLERLEVAHEVADHRVGNTRDPLQDAVAARRDVVVERVRVTRVAEQLGEL